MLRARPAEPPAKLFAKPVFVDDESSHEQCRCEIDERDDIENLRSREAHANGRQG